MEAWRLTNLLKREGIRSKALPQISPESFRTETTQSSARSASHEPTDLHLVQLRDKEVAHTVRNFFQPDGGLCQGRAVSLVPPVGWLPKDEIDELIRTEMKKCEIVLFVIGDTSHSRPWMAREVEIAQSIPLPRFAVQLPGTTGGLPERLAKEGIKPSEWDQKKLCDELNRYLPPRDEA